MTKTEAQTWVDRWKFVRAIELRELRDTPLETRLRQLGALREMIDAFGWEDSLREGEDEVRRRWIRLKTGRAR